MSSAISETTIEGAEQTSRTTSPTLKSEPSMRRPVMERFVVIDGQNCREMAAFLNEFRSRGGLVMEKMNARSFVMLDIMGPAMPVPGQNAE